MLLSSKSNPMLESLGIIHNIKYLHTLRKLPVTQRNILFGVIKVYQQLDKDIRRFKNSTRLNCLSGCGQCCESSKVESTIIEAMPLAVELYRLKQNGQWDSSLLSSIHDRCIFYHLTSNRDGGCCTAYAFRPLMCRLFAFSATRDKYGMALFNTCAIIKKNNLQSFQRAQLLINRGLDIPKMSDYSMRVFNLDPYLSRERFPIMKAISKAFDRVAFLFDKRKFQVFYPKNYKCEYSLKDGF